MTTSPLDGPGETAIGAAMMRAEESLRHDRLFNDPFAAAFIAAAPEAFADGPSSDDPEIARLRDQFCAHMAVRTRFYDDYVVAATRAGLRQVAILGAGLDTRAYRLHWPDGTHVFDVDLPHVLAFKDHVLNEQHASPRCVRISVSADLRHDWTTALTDAGFRSDRPTAWMAEGLVSYLSDDDATRLLRQITRLSQPTSQLALEAAQLKDDDTLIQASTVTSLSDIASLWHGLDHDAATSLDHDGWSVTTHDRAALAATWHRTTRDHSSGGYLTAILGASASAH